MKAEFSEFSYGFALSFEIMNMLRPMFLGAPIFPSLLEEANVGWDVNFTPVGIPVFLQFKIPEYLNVRRSKQWKYYGKPYYRISVHPRNLSNQHNLLKALAGVEEQVYYVAPVFHRVDIFNEQFANNKIYDESAFFSLRFLPNLTDNDAHCVTYDPDLQTANWHSENHHPIESPLSGQMWAESMLRALHEPRRIDGRYFLDLRESLISIIKETDYQYRLVDFLQSHLSGVTTEVIRDVRYLLATFFGVEGIILISPSS